MFFRVDCLVEAHGMKIEMVCGSEWKTRREQQCEKV